MFEKVEDEREMIERHMEILQLVVENEPIGIVNLSNETGYPHHKVRYSLRILEEDELIKATRNGATTTDNTEKFLENHEEKIDQLIAKIESMRINN